MRSVDFDSGAINRHSEASAADALTNDPSGSSGIVPSKPELMKRLIMAKANVASDEYDKAMASEPSQTEVNAELRKEGIDPATATPDEVSKATMRVKLGKEFGLTPAEIEQVMAADAMTPAQLQNFVTVAEINHFEGLSPLAKVRGTDSIQGSHSRTDAAQMTLELGPPTPKMSLVSFISALVNAIEHVLMAKANTQTKDAKVSESRLKDIAVMTDEKISQSDRANAETVRSLRETIDNMRTMRIVMYAVLAIVILIMIIITVVTAVLTGGASAAPLIVATIGLVMAIIGAMTTIALNEAKRKGQLKLTGQEADALVAVLAVAEVIAGIASFGVAAAASLIKTLVVQLVAQIIGAIARMVSLVAQSGALEAWAKRKAQQKFEHSEEKEKIENNATTQIDAINTRVQTGEITRTQGDQLIKQVNDNKTVNLTNLKGKIYDAQLKSDQNIMEIVNWVVVAISLVFAFVTVAASFGLLGKAAQAAIQQAANAMTEGMTKTAQAIMKVVQKIGDIISTLVNTFQTGFQAGMTIKTEIQRQESIERTLKIKQLIIRLEATKAMVEDVKNNLEASAKHSNETFQKMISALSAAFDTNARMMASFTS